MSYIGKIPATGNFVKLDAISVVNGQASYTMQSGSVNFTPESANHMLVSLNGVIQAPITSFSVSGSTITFASALSTGDVINFIMVYGNVLDIGTPSDDTISTAKLQNTSVTAGKLATDSVETAKIQNDAVTTDKINLISTSSTPSLEAKGTSGQTDGYIQLNCEQNSHGIKLKSPPHSAGQSYTLTFPSTAPANNKFLQTNSSGVLSFADAGGGAYIHLQTQTVSSGVAQVDFTSNLATYDTIKFVFSNVHPATDNVTFLALVSTDGGSNYLSTTYNAAGSYLFSAGGNADQGNASDKIILNGACGNANNESQSGFLEMNNLTSTTYYKNTQSLCTGVHDTGALIATHAACSIHQTSAINGVRFKFSSGNIDAGKFSLYGVKRS